MARQLKQDSATAEVLVPGEELIDIDRLSQLKVESNTYGSAYVYGSAAAWNPVSNAEELQSAIATGVAHIQIRNHLDLTSLRPPPGDTHILGTVPSSVKSITVRHCHTLSAASTNASSVATLQPVWVSASIITALKACQLFKLSLD